MSKEIVPTKKSALDRVFTFSDANKMIESFNLDELKLTYSELDVETGEPKMNGIQHHQLIDRILNICNIHNLEYEVTEIFAHKNNKKNADGVAASKALVDTYGQGSAESLIVRRVFTTIQINSFSNDECTTGLVIAYHQDGIQLAIGPNVRVCKNQCILGAERTIQTYGGKDKAVRNLEKVFDVVDDWLHNIEANRNKDLEIIERMKTVVLNYNQVMELIGRLNVIRLCRDSNNDKLKTAEVAKGYPLNQTQINTFTEGYLLKCIELETTEMTMWDIYNIATELYKPGSADLPNIIPQNVIWADYLIKNYL